MMRFVKSLSIVMLLWLGAGVFAASSSYLVPATLEVCPEGPPTCPFDSIQDAIEFAREGDTIIIRAGKYTKNLRIDKGDLTLRGENPEHPGDVIVEAEFSDEPVVLLTDNAQKVQLIGLRITGGKRGIQAMESGDLRLSNLIIDGNEGSGVFLEDVSGGELLNSKIMRNGIVNEEENPYGIGVFLTGRTSFRLTDNLIRDNTQCGLWADEPADVVGMNNAIFSNGEDHEGDLWELCGSVAGREDLLDHLPPDKPTIVRQEPEDWTNITTIHIVIEWENPEDIEYLAAFWFKVGEAPQHPHDGTRRPISTQLGLIRDDLAEGITPVYIWLEDGNGNVTHKNSASVEIRVDRTKPEIEAISNPPPNENGWNNTDVAVFFFCQDQLSGIKINEEGIKVCYEDKTKKNPFPVEIKEGECVEDEEITGTAEDKAGNTEKDEVKVSIDKERPGVDSVKINGDAKYTPSLSMTAEVSISFKRDEKCSGVTKTTVAKKVTYTFKFEIRYQVESHEWSDWESASCTSGTTSPCTKFTIDFTVPDEGWCEKQDEHLTSVTIQVRDLAYNESLTHGDSIIITCISRFPADWPRKTLQQAIEDIPRGATIEITSDRQTNLTINKTLTLKGVGEEQPILKAKEAGQPVVSIESDQKINVTLENLTIAEAQTGIAGDGDGIRVRPKNSKAKNTLVTIKNVRITDNDGDGLDVSGAVEFAVELEDSAVSGNGGDGIKTDGLARVKLTNTYVFGNGDDGLDASATAERSDEAPHLEIIASTIEGNGTDTRCLEEIEVICNGVEVRNRSWVRISDSIIQDNIGWGVAAQLRKCGYAADLFSGTVEFVGLNIIEDNGRGPVCLP